MNLFAFDPDPWTSALWLDDIRKSKMFCQFKRYKIRKIGKLSLLSNKQKENVP